MRFNRNLRASRHASAPRVCFLDRQPARNKYSYERIKPCSTSGSVVQIYTSTRVMRLIIVCASRSSRSRRDEINFYGCTRRRAWRQRSKRFAVANLVPCFIDTRASTRGKYRVTIELAKFLHTVVDDKRERERESVVSATYVGPQRRSNSPKREDPSKLPRAKVGWRARHSRRRSKGDGTSRGDLTRA